LIDWFVFGLIELVDYKQLVAVSTVLPRSSFTLIILISVFITSNHHHHRLQERPDCFSAEPQGSPI